MTEVELLLPGRLAQADEQALRRAVSLLESDTLAAKFSRALGGQVDGFGRLLPSRAPAVRSVATEHALRAALKVSLRTLKSDGASVPSSDRWHKSAAAGGAIGGAFGLSALAWNCQCWRQSLCARSPISRAEGERLSDPETALACLEVSLAKATMAAKRASRASWLRERFWRALSVKAHDMYCPPAPLRQRPTPWSSRTWTISRTTPRAALRSTSPSMGARRGPIYRKTPQVLPAATTLLSNGGYTLNQGLNVLLADPRQTLWEAGSFGSVALASFGAYVGTSIDLGTSVQEQDIVPVLPTEAVD